MEGGELARVLRHETNKTYSPSIPPVVQNLRNTIKNFKISVMDSLEASQARDKQNLAHLKQAVDRLIHLGNILNHELKQKDQAGGSEEKIVQSIRKLFLENGVDFNTLSDSERDLCLYYVKLDLFDFPYAIDKSHTNSIAGIKR